jgi:carboxylesterase type B
MVSGIPYAESPLGELRLRPPVLKKVLDEETFDASNFGPGCLQLVSPHRNRITDFLLFLVSHLRACHYLKIA